MMVRRLADGIGAVAGAAALSQAPEFFQQYLQRLGGRLDQAGVARDRIVAAANAHALTVRDYVGHLVANADPVVRSEGANAAASLADAERLTAAHDALAHAGPLLRPLVFVRDFDAGLARATLDSFVPGVPLSAEAALYAAVGLVLGVLVVAGVERLLAWPVRRRRARWG